jgi:hypothetical protein
VQNYICACAIKRVTHPVIAAKGDNDLPPTVARQRGVRQPNFCAMSFAI